MANTVKKIAFTALLLLYSAFVVYFIVYFTGYGDILKAVKNAYNNLFSSTVRLERIEVSLPEGQLVVGRTVTPVVTFYPSNFPDTEYTVQALTPETVKVSGRSVVGLSAEGDASAGQIKIIPDADPEKAVIKDIQFIKTYPQSTSLTVVKGGERAEESSENFPAYRCTLGVPVFLSVALSRTDGLPVSESGYTVQYDEQYFQKRSACEYLPIREGASRFVLQTAAGDCQVDFAIVAGSMADPSIAATSLENRVYTVGSTVDFYIYDNDGKRIEHDFTFESSNPAVADFNAFKNLVLKSSGETDVTVTTKSGSAYTAHVSVRNVFKEISLSGLSSDGKLHVTEESYKLLVPEYAAGTTYKSVKFAVENENIAKIGRLPSGELCIRGVSAGKTSVTLSSYDDYDGVTGIIQIVVESNVQDAFAAKGLSSVVSKLGGHFLTFIFEGALAFLCAYVYIRPRKSRAALCSAVSLAVCAVVASLTEFLQFFRVGRHPSVTDILIDLGGAAIGIFLLLFVLLIVHAVRRKRAKKTSERKK